MIESEKIIDLSKKYLIAKETYERAVRINIRTSPSMSDKTVFWQMIKDLGDHVRRSVPSRGDPVRYGIQEWLREMWVNGIEGYGIADLPAFIRTYNKLKESVAKKLPSFDDRFSDIVDSLPLAGKECCLRVLAGGVKTPEDLFEIVDGGLVQLVVGKENHVEQWLEQAYADRLCEIITHGDANFALEMEIADP